MTVNSKNTYIYRVENVKGLGPFFGKSQLDEEFIMHYSSPETPLFFDDEIIRKSNVELFNRRASKRWLCGFKSLEQYQRWFDCHDHRCQLHNSDFFIVQYKAIDIIHGLTQSIFKKRGASPVAVSLCHEIALTNLTKWQTVKSLNKQLREEKTQLPSYKKLLKRIFY